MEPSRRNTSPTLKGAFFDIDGTLTDDRTWKGFLGYFKQRRLRLGTHLAFLGVHYPLYALFRLGLVSNSAFRGVWAADMAWYLRGYTMEEAGQVWDWSVEKFLNQHWREEARALLDEHLAAGDLVMLVSSAPAPLVGRIGRELGVEHTIGTSLETNDGRYTGRSLKPTCIDTYKASLAKRYLRERGLEVDFQASHAYADSATDLHLLEMTGSPVAVYPDEKLRAIASQRSWRIIPNETDPRMPGLAEESKASPV